MHDSFGHAKGGGAFGYFEVTVDVREWTRAAFLNTVGKRTPVLALFVDIEPPSAPRRMAA